VGFECDKCNEHEAINFCGGQRNEDIFGGIPPDPDSSKPKLGTLAIDDKMM
jgi:hypothetical protein